MNAQQIIRAAIPDATQEECDYVLWSRTPFPFVKMTAKLLYKAADRIRRAAENGRVLCECCNNAVENEKYLCNKCAGAMSGVRSS